MLPTPETACWCMPSGPEAAGTRRRSIRPAGWAGTSPWRWIARAGRTSATTMTNAASSGTPAGQAAAGRARSWITPPGSAKATRSRSTAWAHPTSAILTTPAANSCMPPERPAVGRRRSWRPSAGSAASPRWRWIRQISPHITYAGPPVGVRYAHCDGRGRVAARDHGQRRLVHLAGAGPRRAAPHGLLRYGGAQPGLWPARRGGLGLQTVDRLADAGSFNALAVSTAALDAAGEPAVAYYEAGHGDLRFAAAVRLAVAGRDGGCRRRRGGGVGGDVGQYPDIALDSAGRAFVSYYDATNGDLKLARQAAGRWQVETVDSGGDGARRDVGRYTSLALDTGGSGAVDQLLRRDERRPQAGPPQLDGRWQVETVDSGDGDVVSAGIRRSLWTRPAAPWISLLRCHGRRSEGGPPAGGRMAGG